MKEFLIYNSLNFYSIIILSIVYVQARKFLKTNDDFYSKIWLLSIIELFIINIADILSWLNLSLSGNIIFLISNISNSIIYIMLTILTSQVALFIEYSLKFSKKSYNFFKKVFLPIIILNTVLSILSIPFGLYYTYDAFGNYILGKYYFINLILVFLPLFIIFLRILFVHKEIRQIKTILILVIFCPVFFLIIHRLLDLPFTIFFPSLTISLIILNFLLINNNLNNDFLTGLQNRRGIDKFFSKIPNTINGYLAVIYIDINGFKAINDNYGHKEGDEALITFSKIINKVIRINDLAGRHGGDEFLIAMLLNAESEYKIVINRLLSELDKYNQKEIKPYKLSFSYGLSITKPNELINKDKIIETADYNMYKHKIKKA